MKRIISAVVSLILIIVPVSIVSADGNTNDIGTYGKKTTRVNDGVTKKCYSNQVTGNDGLSAWVQYYAV